MKSLRRLIKLFFPMGPFVLWVRWRYPKVNLPEKVAIKGALKPIWWIVPYGVFCVNAQVVASDRQPLKYWMPYGKMCRLIAERYGYVVNRGVIEEVGGFVNSYQRTLKNEAAFLPLVRWIRRWSPYGIVLWWDRVDADALRKSVVQKTNAPSSCRKSDVDVRALSRQIQQLDKRVKELESLIKVKSDNLEIQLLKIRLAIGELSRK